MSQPFEWISFFLFSLKFLFVAVVPAFKPSEIECREQNRGKTLAEVGRASVCCNTDYNTHSDFNWFSLYQAHK